MQRALAPGVSGHSTLAGWLVSCLLRSRSRKRPAWCLSLTRLTRLWRSSPEEPFLRPLLDLSMSIGPLKVRSPGPLSRAGGHLFPSIVGHISGSPGEPVPPPQRKTSRGHITWEDVLHGLALVVGMGCPVTGPSFLPKGRRAFGQGFAIWAPCLSHLLPLWCLLIAGSGARLGRQNTTPFSPFSSVSIRLSPL